MKATLKITNSQKIEKVLNRAEAAVQEFRRCLWELQDLGIEVELKEEHTRVDTDPPIKVSRNPEKGAERNG